VSSDFEGVLPASLDSERSVLGAILLDNAAFYEASEKLASEDFHLSSHQRIFARMSDLISSGHAIDIVTLAESLSKKKEIEAVGGVAYVASLMEGLPYRISITEYIEIIKDKSVLRQTITQASRIITAAADQSTDADEIVAEAQTTFQTLAEQNIASGLQSFGEYVKQQYPRIDAIFEQNARADGIRSGLRELDRLTCGFQRQDLIVIAARPAMGKTSAACCIALEAGVVLNKKVAFFSLEMAKRAILNRMLAARAGVPLWEIQEGRTTDTSRLRVSTALGEIAEAPIYIDDAPGQSIQQIRSKSMVLKNRAGLDLIIIDQLNHITPPEGSRRYGNRVQEVGMITRGAKAMAKSLDIPVIILHQLSRETAKRTDHEPVLSDLRESGDVEQDSDLVIFPHRPEYYEPTNEELRGKAVFIVAKQRQGPIGRASCEYIAEQCRFWDGERKYGN